MSGFCYLSGQQDFSFSGNSLEFNAAAQPRGAVRRVGCSEWCTPGMGVSVGVQVPCRRFTFMSRKIHEANYESKARASPRGEV